MRKHNEQVTASSCFNKARADEMIFVLLARDEAAPTAIRAWVAERIRTKKNSMADEQIREALICADLMEAER